MRVKAIAILLILQVLFFACASDSNKEQSILGYWQLESATVQGEDTDRLDDLYFVFNGNGFLKTNIFGETDEYEYKWRNGNIEQLGEPPLVYDVVWHSDTTIDLQTEILKKEFVLSLLRSEMLTESSDIFQ